MEWLVEHAVEITAIFVGLSGVAKVIVNLTDTPKDNEIYKKVYKVIEVFAGIVTSKAKQTSDAKTPD